MGKIIVNDVKVAELPPRLRGDLAADQAVRVMVEPTAPPSAPGWTREQALRFFHELRRAEPLVADSGEDIFAQTL